MLNKSKRSKKKKSKNAFLKPLPGVEYVAFSKVIKEAMHEILTRK